MVGLADPREIEVLVAVARGLSNAEIGNALYMSAATAKTHVGRLLTKLNARDRTHLVIAAYEAETDQPGLGSAISSFSSSLPTAIPPNAARVCIGMVPIILTISGSCKISMSRLASSSRPRSSASHSWRVESGPSGRDSRGASTVIVSVATRSRDEAAHGDHELTGFDDPLLEPWGPECEGALVELAARTASRPARGEPWRSPSTPAAAAPRTSVSPT